MSDKELENKAELNSNPTNEPKKEKQPTQQEAPKEIRIEIGGGKKLNNEFAHNTPQDVNANVGSFGSDIKDPSKEETPKQDELIVSDKSKKFENIKGKDVEIDFEKFNKRKLAKQKKQKQYKPGKSKFSVTLDTWLHNRSTCIKVWMVALAIMVVCLAIGLGLAIPSVLHLKKPTDYWLVYKGEAIAGTVFGFISATIFFIPLIYLLVTVLVGINGTAQSRVFHYFLWSCLIVSVVCLILCCGLCGHVMAAANSFVNFPTK